MGHLNQQRFLGESSIVAAPPLGEASGLGLEEGRGLAASALLVALLHERRGTGILGSPYTSPWISASVSLLCGALRPAGGEDRPQPVGVVHEYAA